MVNKSVLRFRQNGCKNPLEELQKSSFKVRYLEEVNPQRQVVFTEKNSKLNASSYLQRIFASYGLADVPKLSPVVFYKMTNDLAFQCKYGTQEDPTQKAKDEALLKLQALAIYYYNPFKTTKEYKYWHSYTDIDDVTQIILIALMRALNSYDWQRSGKSPFASFMKAWIVGELKSEKKKSLPYTLPSRVKNLELDEVFSINEVLEKTELLEDDCFIGPNNTFEKVEKDLMKIDLIRNLRGLPEKVGEILIYSYALEDDFIEKHTLIETAEKFDLTIKQVRLRQLKAMEWFKELYPNFYDDYLAA